MLGRKGCRWAWEGVVLHAVWTSLLETRQSRSNAPNVQLDVYGILILLEYS